MFWVSVQKNVEYVEIEKIRKGLPTNNDLQ